MNTTHSTLAGVTERQRRLAILVNLSLAPRYTLTLASLKPALEAIGYAASFVTLRADSGFLEETGLV